MSAPDELQALADSWRHLMIVRLATENGLDPDHLQVACEAAYGSPLKKTDDLAEMVRALKAFAARHEQMVRAKVAEEIEPILKDLRKAARTHHYLIACEGTDSALARLRAQIRGEL